MKPERNDGWIPTTKDGHRLMVQLRTLVQRAAPNALDDAAYQDLLHNFTFAAMFVGTLRLHRDQIADWYRRLADDIEHDHGTTAWWPPALPPLSQVVNAAALEELNDDERNVH